MFLFIDFQLDLYLDFYIYYILFLYLTLHQSQAGAHPAEQSSSPSRYLGHCDAMHTDTEWWAITIHD